MGSDDWGVSAGHTVMPDTTVVYVRKDERVNAAGTLATFSIQGAVGEEATRPAESTQDANV